MEYRYGMACAINARPMHEETHSHDGIELTFFSPGEAVLLRFGGSHIEVRPENTLLFWAAVPHQILRIRKDTLQYWVTIPLEIFLRWKLPGRRVQELLSGKVLWELDPELRELDLRLFPLWIEESKSKVPADRTTLSLSLEDRMRRFKTTEKSSGKVVASQFKPADQAECGEFLTLLRVSEAQRLLLTTHMKVIDIAMEAGFDSMSNFYTCFNRVCGRNPRAYRRMLTTANMQVLPPHPGGTRSGRRLLLHENYHPAMSVEVIAGAAMSLFSRRPPSTGSPKRSPPGPSCPCLCSRNRSGRDLRLLKPAAA